MQLGIRPVRIGERIDVNLQPSGRRRQELCVPACQLMSSHRGTVYTGEDQDSAGIALSATYISYGLRLMDHVYLMDCLTPRRLPISLGNILEVTGLMPFNAAPSVDVLAEQAFLPKDPLILLQEGTVNVVPVIAGIMEHEGYAFYCDMARTFKLQGDDFFNTKNAGKYFPSILDVEPEMTTVFNRIKEEYFGDKDCNDPDTFELTLAKAIGDITFDAGIARSVDLLSKAGVPIRTYIYNQISNLSMVAFFGGKRGKYVSHGDEIFQQFVAQLPGFAEKTKEDKKMANIMSSIWTKFAYGSFDNLVTSDNEVIEWPIYAEQKPYHLLLNIQPSVREGRISDKVDFWGNIIPKLVNNHRAKDEL